jgi:predicted DNA-binding transcriptional regulator AlpA
MLLQFRDLKPKGIDYSKIHVWRLIKLGRFPRPMKLTDSPGARNYWDEREIDDFLASRKAARDQAA